MVSAMSKPLEEIMSNSLNYKAAIFETEETPARFESIVYYWNEDLKDDEGNPLWERVAGPFIVDNMEAAKHLAQKHLNLMAGEVEDESIDESLKNEIQEALGHTNFTFVETANYEVSFLKDSESEDFVSIEAQKIFIAGDFYYVETNDHEWLSGFLYDEGVVRCWQKFVSPKNALIATQ